MYDRIIVPLDGSDLAEQALAEAVNLAKLTGDRIFLIRVVDFTTLRDPDAFASAADFGSFEAAMKEEEETASTYLEQQAEKIRNEDELSVEVGVVKGPVSKAIHSASIPGDLIVMASHGRSGISRWLMGSVAEDVVRHSESPVLLVRAKAGEN